MSESNSIMLKIIIPRRISLSCEIHPPVWEDSTSRLKPTSNIGLLDLVGVSSIQKLHHDEANRSEVAIKPSIFINQNIRAQVILILIPVVISMLNQPLPAHPINDEGIMSPTFPKLNASNLIHPHCLSNGVRLRPALGTIINDLFARQAPPPPYRHLHILNSKVTTPQEPSR